MAPTPQLDLSPIYRRPVFHSRSAAQTQRALAREIIDHDLRWGRGDVFTALYRRDLADIGMMILRYGAEVEVTPAALRDFVLVQMPLAGAAEIECETRTLSLRAGEAAVVAPQHAVRLLWQPGCEQLILKIPAELYRQAAGIAGGASLPGGDGRGGWSTPIYKLAPSLVPQWLSLVQQLVMLLGARQDGASPAPAGAVTFDPAWVAHFERTAALFLYSHQPDGGVAANAGDDGHDTDDDGEGVASRLARMEAFVRARLCAPLSLDDLARAACVSPRTLNAMCRRHRGVSPMVLVRNLRLDAVRRELVARPGASLTDLALTYGFGHLGRFAAYYRARFGELPTQTRRHPPDPALAHRMPM